MQPTNWIAYNSTCSKKPLGNGKHRASQQKCKNKDICIIQWSKAKHSNWEFVVIQKRYNERNKNDNNDSFSKFEHNYIKWVNLFLYRFRGTVRICENFRKYIIDITMTLCHIRYGIASFEKCRHRWFVYDWQAIFGPNLEFFVI